jgi:hypothetical protein
MTIKAEDKYCRLCHGIHPIGGECKNYEWKYKSYDNQRVLILDENKEGEAFESAFGFISVFVDGEEKARMFDMKNIKLL